MTRLPFLAAVAILCVSAVHAQVPMITDVFPEAASPGDEISIFGTGLSNATHVRFIASVGGFVGQLSSIQAVSFVSPTEVRATVPMINAFAPPGTSSPGDPRGSLTVRDAGGLMTAPSNFFFLEGTFNQTMTVGAGTTLASGRRSATSFTFAGGAPAYNNANFVLTLDNATPGSSAFLAFGDIDTTPGTMVGDGLFIIDPSFIQVVGPFPVDLQGRVVLPTPIPPGIFGVTVAIQWGFADVGGVPALSTGLVTILAL